MAIWADCLGRVSRWAVSLSKVSLAVLGVK